MKFIIRNIGTIDSAEIELNNLTVISGENNSGKTTISKIAYAVGQASSSFPIDYKRHQYNEFRKLYDEISFNVSRLLRNSEGSKENILYQKLMSVLLDIRRSSEVTEFDLSITKELIDELSQNLNLDERNSDFLKRIYSIFDKLDLLYNEYNYNDPIDKFIFRALKNEFSNELLNKRNGASEAYLSLEIDKIKIFEITFNNKDILSFSSENNKLPIKDSTLIEGPYIFQLAPLIHDLSFRESISRRSTKINPKIPYHVLDLCSKLDGSRGIENNNNSLFFNLNVEEFYKGYIDYNIETNNFELKENNLIFNLNNVSSGMKSIAILDLLCKGYFINNETILIIDEPETNLHPQWQNLYAKFLIKLANQGTHILINTHSPYMLESLKVYSDKSDQNLGTKFYFSHKQENLINIDDTNGNIIPIIDALSAPLYSLMEELEDVDNF
ncbi:AAA family ATPase [Acinetobacter baumannii]|uniref:AAA family ATPase n=2 Tax=Acinetobacter baumannii TaxID=470 RepID=UPI001487F8C0|nr:AAA family ATPase [Acinetobacter baumannii]